MRGNNERDLKFNAHVILRMEMWEEEDLKEMSGNGGKKREKNMTMETKTAIKQKLKMSGVPIRCNLPASALCVHYDSV